MSNLSNFACLDMTNVCSPLFLVEGRTLDITDLPFPEVAHQIPLSGNTTMGSSAAIPQPNKYGTSASFVDESARMC